MMQSSEYGHDRLPWLSCRARLDADELRDPEDPDTCLPMKKIRYPFVNLRNTDPLYISSLEFCSVHAGLLICATIVTILDAPSSMHVALVIRRLVLDVFPHSC